MTTTDEAVKQTMDIDRFEVPGMDKAVATFILAAKLQHECPWLNADDFWKSTTLSASSPGRLSIHVMSWNGASHPDDDPDDKYAKPMRLFRALASHFKPLDKKLNEHTGMYLEREYEFGGHTITLGIYPPSGVCQQKDTGKTEKKLVKKVVRKASTKEVEEEVPIMEWECPPVFVGGDN